MRALVACGRRTGLGGRRWGRLSFHLRKIKIEAGPFRRGPGPDGRHRRRQIGIVKRSRAHEDKRRPLFGLAENAGAASGAEATVHGRAAVGLTHVVSEGTRNGDVRFAEERADRSSSRAEILADPAPAIAGPERRLRLDREPHRPAQTSARNRQKKVPVTVPKQLYVKLEAPASNCGLKRDFAPQSASEG